MATNRLAPPMALHLLESTGYLRALCSRDRLKQLKVPGP
jgi:hypothetical protein